MILVVRAKNGRGRPLEMLSGPVLPDWCGTEALKNGYYAGLPGRTYVKLIEDIWTKEFPTAAY